jgi:hypothetical protein
MYAERDMSSKGDSQPLSPMADIIIRVVALRIGLPEGATPLFFYASTRLRH